MKNSLKQLLRTPGKTALLFLLVVASTALLVFSSVLYARTDGQIRQAEREFATIGTIEQQPLVTDLDIRPNCCFGTRTYLGYDYGELLSPEALKFEGAQYLIEPENRPCYVAYLPDIYTTRVGSQLSWRMHTVEFTPLEDSDGSAPVKAKVTRVLFNNVRDYQKEQNGAGGGWDKNLEVGDVIDFCQHLSRNPQPIETGKTYIGNLFYLYPESCPTHHYAEWVAHQSPSSRQCARNGEPVHTGHFPEDGGRKIEEVTADFYEPGQRGEDWLKLVEMKEMEDYLFRVLPTNSLELLPSFHKKLAYVDGGRAISAEEFETGAPVCMLPKALADRNRLEVGDTVTLPLLCAMYGCTRDDTVSTLPEGILLDAGGEYFEPFWKADYKIVGTYSLTNEGGGGAGEIPADLFIIPMKSVGASDKNNLIRVSPMNRLTASFQIKNGTIAEFDEKLHAAAPETALLTISYDDGGYTDVMSGLQRAKSAAVLLLTAGILAAAVIAVLLLYFAVVRQKKRTAIERSLGMTKGQCRRSLLAGLLVLTLLGTAIGSGAAAVLMERYSSTPSGDSLVTVDNGDFLGSESFLYGFSTRYSQWTAALSQAEVGEAAPAAASALYAAVPAAFVILLFLLALLLIHRSLRIEPIYLLSGKPE